MSTEVVPVDFAAPTPVRRRLRIWPAIPLLMYLIAARVIWPFVQQFDQITVLVLLLVPMICCGLIVLWWLFLSRARWSDRLLGLGGAIALGGAAVLLGDPSIRGIPVPLFVFIVPPAVIAFTVSVLVFSVRGSRAATVAALIAVACAMGYWDTVRFDGVWGNFKSTMRWRWAKSSEDEFLASLPAKSPATLPGKSEPLGKIDWPAFRGRNRDGSVPGVVLATDWSSRPPKQIWRHKVGPGWSSFVVAGNRLFTQEQRGDKEDAVCYDAKTGEELWAHETPARFYEGMGGVGPRATPTLGGGLLYVQGATGLLQCLDPLSGAVKWQRDITKDAKRDKLPTWGFSSSPLIVGDKVITYAGGEDDFALLAYDVASGEPKWHAAAGKDTYSSPQLAKLAGREVVLLLDDTGLTAVDAQSGKPAWTYEWINKFYRIVQPMVIGKSDLLLGTGMGGMQLGIRRISLVEDKGGAVKFEDRWSTTDLKPAFNDYVAYDGYLYGLDHNILCCVDLATGTKKWKNGRYGNGQILLLPDAGQLLVLSETGDLVLIRANPSKLEELARHNVLEGKTWNHPVLVGNRIYLRNAEEAACFEVPLAGQSTGELKRTAPKEL
jgi:outer membrane protein assembly factor BamB